MRASPLSVGRRISGLDVGLLVALTVCVGYAIRTMRALEQNGPVVNLAGRQRMLNQRHAREALTIALGGEADIETTRALLRESVVQLREGSPISLGGAEVDPPAPSPEVARLFENQRLALELSEQRVDEFLGAVRDGADIEAALKAMLARTADSHAVAHAGTNGVAGSDVLAAAIRSTTERCSSGAT